MKKITLIIIVFSFIFQANSQDNKIDIARQFLDYCNLFIQKDFVRATDYLNEDFVKLFTRNSMKEILEINYTGNSDFDIKIDSPKVIRVDDIKKINNLYYVKIIYSNIVTMKFEEIIVPKDITNIDSNGNKRPTLTEFYQAEYGRDNVRYDAMTKSYTISKIKYAIANSKDNIHWKFVPVEKWYKSVLDKCIPKEFLEDK